MISAQLSFQILGPADKSVEIKPRKRKASSSEEMHIIKVDLKENDSIVPDKKLRLEHNEDLKQKINVGKEKQNGICMKEKHVSDKNTSVKDFMEVEERIDKKDNTQNVDGLIEIINDNGEGIIDTQETIVDVKETVIEKNKKLGKNSEKSEELNNVKNQIKDNECEESEDITKISDGGKVIETEIDNHMSTLLDSDLFAVTTCESDSESENYYKDQSMSVSNWHTVMLFYRFYDLICLYVDITLFNPQSARGKKMSKY